MNTLYTSLSTTPRYVIGARILQIFAGAVVLYRVLSEFRFTTFLYEPSGSGLLGTLLPVYVALALWFFGGLALIGGVWTRLATLALLLGYLLLEMSTVVQDGGDNILRIVLAYMLLFHDRLGRPETIRPGARVFVHNIAVLAVTAQVCLMYLVAGTLKLNGDVWMNGTALYYITHVEAYSTAWMWLRNLMLNPILVPLATYATIIYQIGFPFMLRNRYHLAWVALGVVFHLGILVMMGLTTFAAVMIGLVLFTVSDSEWQWLRGLRDAVWSGLLRVQARWSRRRTTKSLSEPR